LKSYFSLVFGYCSSKFAFILQNGLSSELFGL